MNAEHCIALDNLYYERGWSLLVMPPPSWNKSMGWRIHQKLAPAFKVSHKRDTEREAVDLALSFLRFARFQQEEVAA